MIDAAMSDLTSKDLMKKHFLLIRKQEKERIIKSSLTESISELKKSYEEYEDKADILPIEHLKRWSEAIGSS